MISKTRYSLSKDTEILLENSPKKQMFTLKLSVFQKNTRDASQGRVDKEGVKGAWAVVWPRCDQAVF